MSTRPPVVRPSIWGASRLVAALVLPALPASAYRAAPTFRDCTADLGLAIGNDAACWVDIDNDGWPDLVAGGGVWRNEGGRSFRKVADVGASVAGDFNNDGFADLFCWSQIKLYRNEGGLRFREEPLPELPPTSSRGACWGDWNNDGWLDLFVGGFEDWERQITFPSVILMNNGGTSFRLAWSDAAFRTRGVSACDWNRDGALDIYVSNYRLQPNRLFVNDGKGVFRDAASEMNAVATSEGFAGGHSIGAAWGDFDGDGWIDLFAGNFAHRDTRGDQPKSRFLRNTGPTGAFRFDDKGTCGVFYQESYASPAAADYDNDGRLDLYFTTVYDVASFGIANNAVLFRNQGDWAFVDATASAGLSGQPPTYQAAWADFDRDGRLDLVTGGRLWHNEGTGGHWLQVRLWGDGKGINRLAIGAQVRVALKDRVLTRQVEAGTGEGNQNDLTLHFGLGDHARKVDLEVLWPGGRVQKTRGVAVDRLVVIGRAPKRPKQTHDTRRGERASKLLQSDPR